MRDRVASDPHRPSRWQLVLLAPIGHTASTLASIRRVVPSSWAISDFSATCTAMSWAETISSVPRTEVAVARVPPSDRYSF